MDTQDAGVSINKKEGGPTLKLLSYLQSRVASDQDCGKRLIKRRTKKGPTIRLGPRRTPQKERKEKLSPKKALER